MTANGEAAQAELRASALAAIDAAQTLAATEELRVHLLGRRGELTAALRGVGGLDPAARRAAGQALNRVKEEIEAALEARVAALGAQETAARLTAEAIDITLPGRRPALGHGHPLARMRQEIETIFRAMGYVVADGPEIESEWYNFDALNIPAGHPARAMHDSFFLDAPPEPGPTGGRLLLRTHTSPVQMRYMQSRAGQLPVRMIAPGRVYRRDDDATHAPMFHQVEGLLLDTGVSFADLKGTLSAFAKALFGPQARIRLRPSYFPFTEPSAEVDVSCVFCGGQGCRTCKASGWIEVLGAGMVHPRVITAGGFDPEACTGFAFGLGVDRLAMLRYHIEDMRLLFEGDMRFLERF